MRTEAVSHHLVVYRDISSSVIERIDGFGKLQPGWHFGEGIAPSERTRSEAMQIASLFEWHGWNVEAFPGTEGDVLVSARSGESF